MALEQELHRTRLALLQAEAQRDFLVDRIVALESAERQRAAGGPIRLRDEGRAANPQAALGAARAPGAGRKRARAAMTPEERETEDRTGLCVATLKSGKLCRRKQSGASQYCGYHSPLDPASGQMYCRHKSTRGRNCGNPVPVGGSGLCKYHQTESVEGDA